MERRHRQSDHHPWTGYDCLVETPHENDDKPTVLLIVTGGTITMVHGGVSQSLKPESITEGLRTLPELKDPSLPNFDILEWQHLVDSSDVSLEEWTTMCHQIQEHYGEYDGFVIVHGTDTMAYTASALSFMLEHLGKPVVLTGAMLPIKHIRTDGRRNLTVAMMIAGYSGITEVCVLFGSRLLRGNRGRKLDCFHMEAFDSPNFPPIGRVGVDITVDEQLLLTPSKRAFRTFTHLCRQVIVLKLTAGLPPNLLLQIFASPTRPLGVILELYGSGTAPRGHPEFLDAIKQGIESGVEIAAVTQCHKGSCSLLTYENGVFLYHMGVIECKDMTPEAAYAKMSYLMGKGYAGQELRKMMETDLRGEITQCENTVTGATSDAHVGRTRSKVSSSATSLVLKGPAMNIVPTMGTIAPELTSRVAKSQSSCIGTGLKRIARRNSREVIVDTSPINQTNVLSPRPSDGLDVPPDLTWRSPDQSRMDGRNGVEAPPSPAPEIVKVTGSTCPRNHSSQELCVSNSHVPSGTHTASSNTSQQVDVIVTGYHSGDNTTSNRNDTTTPMSWGSVATSATLADITPSTAAAANGNGRTSRRKSLPSGERAVDKTIQSLSGALEAALKHYDPHHSNPHHSNHYDTQPVFK